MRPPIGLQPRLFEKSGDRCEICGYSYREIFGITDQMSLYRLFADKDGSIPFDRGQNFHCICENCLEIYKGILQNAKDFVRNPVPFEALSDLAKKQCGKKNRRVN